MRYQFGDVILVDFPFSDSRAEKRRPGLVLDYDSHGDLLVARITSNPPERATDVWLDDWNIEGLNIPSTVRLLKLAMTNESYVLRYLGRLSVNDISSVVEALRSFVLTLETV
jgi:mRNA interferase MazF